MTLIPWYLVKPRTDCQPRTFADFDIILLGMAKTCRGILLMPHRSPQRRPKTQLSQLLLHRARRSQFISEDFITTQLAPMKLNLWQLRYPARKANLTGAIPVCPNGGNRESSLGKHLHGGSGTAARRCRFALPATQRCRFDSKC